MQTRYFNQLYLDSSTASSKDLNLPEDSKILDVQSDSANTVIFYTSKELGHPHDMFVRDLETNFDFYTSDIDKSIISCDKNEKVVFKKVLKGNDGYVLVQIIRRTKKKETK